MSNSGKECLSIKLGIEAFHVYLLGREFLVQTDHRALQWLTNFKDQNSRLMQWSLVLQSYTFKIQHRKGTDNVNAYALSSMPWEEVQTCGGGRSVTGHQGSQQTDGNQQIDGSQQTVVHD